MVKYGVFELETELRNSGTLRIIHLLAWIAVSHLEVGLNVVNSLEIKEPVVASLHLSTIQSLSESWILG